MRSHAQVVREVRKLEADISFIRACTRLAANEEWLIVASALAVKVESLTKQLVDDDLSYEDMRVIKSEIRCYQRMLDIPQVSESEVKRVQGDLDRNIALLAKLENYGLDRESGLPAAQAGSAPPAVRATR